MSDYSILFSSLSSSSSSSSSSASDLLGISYTDYASIRNGSYRKLVSAYYSSQSSDSTSSSGTTISDSKSKLNSINDAATSLKDSASALLTTGKNSLFETKVDEAGNSYVDYDEDEVYKAVQSFISDYNDLLDTVGETETTSLLRAADSLVSYVKANKSALESIGITIGSDNKLSVDEDTFKAASKAQVQSIFQSTGGFAYQVEAKASLIANYAADMAKQVSSSSTSSSSTSTSTSSDSSKTIASIEEAAEAATSSLSVLRATGTNSLFVKTSGEYDTDSIYEALKQYLDDYNTLLEKTKDSDSSSILSARTTLMSYATENKTALAAIGITIASDGTLSIDEDTFKASDMSSVKSLFQGSSSWGYQMEKQIAKIEAYAEIEAAKSNTYSDSGTYTYNYTSGDLVNSLV